MINFSILIPSRGRCGMLVDFMKSIIEKTDKINEVEILIKIDDDDVTSDYIVVLADNFGPQMKELNYKVFVAKQTINLSDDYYNFLAKQAEGKYLWAVNDDCEILSSSWDSVILQRAKENNFENKIAYYNIGVRGHSQVLFSPFPMITKETVEALGHFHDPLIKGYDADIVIWNTFNALRDVRGHDRLVDCNDVWIHHINSQGSLHDETQEGLKRNHLKHGGTDAGGFKDRGGYKTSSAKLDLYIKEKGY